MQVAAALVVCVYGEIVVAGALDVVFGGWELDLRLGWGFGGGWFGGFGGRTDGLRGRGSRGLLGLGWGRSALRGLGTRCLVGLGLGRGVFG